MRGRNSGAIPRPVSLTLIRALLFVLSNLISTLPCSGVNSIALVSRFKTTCRKRLASPATSSARLRVRTRRRWDWFTRRPRALWIRSRDRLGRALVGQQLYSEALDAFEELLKLDPENLLAHYEIGKLNLSTRSHPDEELLYRFHEHKRGFNRENLLAHYEIGKLSLSTQNYAGAIAKYLWLRSQSVSSTTDLSDPSYELLPRKPRTGELTQNPFHQAYASELALYLLDLIPPEVAEQNRLPASQIVYVTPYDTPKDSSQKRQVNLACAKPVEPKTHSRPTILYHEKAKYTEIARINRLEGTVSLSVVFNTSGQITDIRVIRGLPDGLTRRAIHAVRQICFEPATIDDMPVNARGEMELNFHLPPDGIVAVSDRLPPDGGQERGRSPLPVRRFGACYQLPRRAPDRMASRPPAW